MFLTNVIKSYKSSKNFQETFISGRVVGNTDFSPLQITLNSLCDRQAKDVLDFNFYSTSFISKLLQCFLVFSSDLGNWRTVFEMKPFTSKKYFLSEHFHATVLVQWLQRCLFRQGVVRLLLWKLCFRSSYEYSLNDYCLPWFHYQQFPKHIVYRNRHVPGVMKQCYLVASLYQFFLRHAYLTLDFLRLFFIDVFGGSQTLLSVEVRIFSKAMSLLLTYITVFSSRLRMFVWNERSILLILLIFGYKDMHDGCIAETSLPISLITKWKFAVNSFSWKREACKLLIT